MKNWQETILRQYANSSSLLSLIDLFNQAIGQEKFSELIVNHVLDIDQCNSYALDCWGKIVGISRYLKVDDELDVFGFSGASTGSLDTFAQPFNVSPFYLGKRTSSIERLTDDAFRELILLKAYKNIHQPTIENINYILRSIFSNGRTYCIDNQNMTMNIVFEFQPTTYQLSILKYSDVLPRPAGVLIELIVALDPYFGFAIDSYPFNDGTFYVKKEN